VRIAALLMLHPIAHAEPASVKVIITPAVIQIPKIEAFGLAEPEDLKPTQKTPIQKMQESLDKVGRIGKFYIKKFSTSFAYHAHVVHT
jgi:hypothetical protein